MQTFKQIPALLVDKLVDFARNKKNLGKTIEIENIKYKFDHINYSKNAFFQSRSISIYFITGRSIIRISDHWSKSNHNNRSRKLNCGTISNSVYWNLDNKPNSATEIHGLGSGKYPYKVYGGICGLSALNKDCDHWLNKNKLKSKYSAHDHLTVYSDGKYCVAKIYGHKITALFPIENNNVRIFEKAKITKNDLDKLQNFKGKIVFGRLNDYTLELIKQNNGSYVVTED